MKLCDFHHKYQKQLQCLFLAKEEFWTAHWQVCKFVAQETRSELRLPARPISPIRFGFSGKYSGSVGARGEQGGVVREAESVKCLVETQSPSLATDPCLLSEEQSWASQLPF